MMQPKNKRFHKIGLISLALLASFVPRAQTMYKVSPVTADPYVVRDTSSNYAYINPSVTPLNKLLVFLPGTGAPPAAYTNLLMTAANMGYHTLGLMYNNDSLIGSLCASKPATCQGSARAEIFYGKNYSSVIHVDSSEAIRTRLTAALKYLQKNHPSDNWGQFLASDDSIQWNSVCVSGHSQGAGMASIIAYWYPVYRGIFFSTGGDWVASVNNVASWMEMPSVTPPSRKYSFTHRRDELFWGSHTYAPVIWDTLGIGNYLNFDTLTTGFHNGHSFTSYDSTGIPPGLTRFHGATVSNTFSPIVSGKLLYQPLWKYLLGDSTLIASEKEWSLPEFSIYPNPSKEIIQIDLSGSFTNPLVSLSDLTGRGLLSVKPGGNSCKLDVSGLAPGIYLIRVTEGNLTGTRKLAKW